jgi:periplasmic divalent cation tolerance protein
MDTARAAGVKGDFPAPGACDQPRSGQRDGMHVAWTTCPGRTEAVTLGRQAVEKGLAACAQVDGPVTSIFRWQGRIEETDEYRLTFKVLDDNVAALESFVLAHHPYQTAQWLSVRADHVSKNYLNWASSNP